MIRRLRVTEDHLKLFPFILLEDRDDEVAINKTFTFEVQSSVLEDMSLILGLRDKAIPNTENDAEGRAFPDDIEDYMISLYHDLVDNLYLWESLIHQYVGRGGLTVGTYKCVDKELVWELETETI